MTTRIDPVMEHAVVVSLRLGSASSDSDGQRLQQLAGRCQLALQRVDGGEFGGLDIRAGYCLLYCYGADAGDVYSAIEPLVADYGPEPGSWAIKRFGAATDLAAPRERVDLSR